MWGNLLSGWLPRRAVSHLSSHKRGVEAEGTGMQVF